MIQIEKLSKRYGGRTWAVREIDLTVEQGELVVLLGESGCGKTTTLKMVNRLIRPTSGKVIIDGKDTSRISATRLRRHIGYVFQRIGLLPHMTVEENVGIVPRLLGWERDKISSRIDELLELVHLEPTLFRGRLPRELSGGQQQRVGFARALAAEPTLMLLDEPFGALDPITRDSLQTEVKQIQEQLNLTAIMVTHDMTEALLLADRIAVMQEGRIVQLGTPHELMTRPQSEYVQKLMATPKRQADALEAIAERGATVGAPASLALSPPAPGETAGASTASPGSSASPESASTESSPGSPGASGRAVADPPADDRPSD